MSKKPRNAISPTREEDYSGWYQEVVKLGDLAENSPVRGCMVIKPWGYRIWEKIQRILDREIKKTGHQNAYFPLFIPLSFLQKEADHVEGFATECAIVTHHRLEKNAEGKLVPAGELDEPLIVRPTSETIIGETFSKWVQSYRDLPLLINQWCNIVRWEMRTRIFLRTAEILWQEGHTAHATKEEAEEETARMLGVYHDFCKNALAMPVICGEKTEKERFPGADKTFTIEAMMQDRKALQAGTSHFLGQRFAKASNIRFRNKEGGEEFAWTTSWGSTTRLIGSMVMVHGDDDGLILPPKVASVQVAIIPIVHKEEQRSAILNFCNSLASELKQLPYAEDYIDAIVDDRDMTNGEKTWHWIKKGVPIRVEIGGKELESNLLTIAKRHLPHKQYEHKPRAEFVSQIIEQLDAIQEALYQKALAFRNQHLIRIDSKKDFYEFFTPKNQEKPEIHGGFALAHWCGDPAIEKKVQEELGVTIRCIPFEFEKEAGVCPFTNAPSPQRVIFAKAY